MSGKLWFMLFLFSSCNLKFALANNELCDLCVDIVSSIEAYLQDGHTQEEIIAVLDQLCEKITGGNPILTDICEGLVEAKLPDIIEYLVNGLPPYEICQTITGDCPDDVTSTTTTPIPPDEWYHIETLLEGGRYLTLMDDHRFVEMYGRNEHLGQFWRIEGNGCLRNRNHPTRCLAILGDSQGALLEMLEGNGQDEQHWTFTDDNYIVSKLRGDLLNRKLVLDVMWADVPLITDGAGVHVWHEDDSASEKWKFVLIQ